MRHGHRSREHDVRPRLGQCGGQGDHVGTVPEHRVTGPGEARRPLASASFTMTVQPASFASASAGAAETSSRFQVACTAEKSGEPSISMERARRRVADCAGPLRLSPTGTPSWASAPAPGASRGCRTPGWPSGSGTAAATARAERALRPLAVERGDGMVLDLGDRRIHLPLRRVRVAPLRRHRHLPGPDAPAGQPRCEELLGAPVRPGGVEPPDPARPRGVADLVAPPLEGADRPVRAECLAVADRQVSGTAQSGETQAQHSHLSGRPSADR